MPPQKTTRRFKGARGKRNKNRGGSIIVAGQEENCRTLVGGHLTQQSNQLLRLWRDDGGIGGRFSAAVARTDNHWRPRRCRDRHRILPRRAIHAGAARGGAGGGIIGRAREVHDGAVGGGG